VAAPRITASKVPTIGLAFWVLKLLTTALGESTSDALIHGFNPVPVVLVTGVLFSAVMAYQLWRPRYQTLAYWGAVVMVGIFGTMVADVVHVALHVPYTVSTVVFAVALAAVFTTWRRVEGTLSIHSITTSRRECFYWASVCGTFAMGTALGDLTAATWHWGFLLSGLVFTGLFALPGLAFRTSLLGPISAFWISYVLTRPLGASFADYFGKPTANGGLGWHASHVAVALAVPFVALALWRRRVEEPLG
jgi:uncharacterized membrane-anchored protein